MAPDPDQSPVEYRLSPAVVARLYGLGLVALALVMFAGTALVAWTGVNADVLVILVAAGVIAIFAGGWYLRSRAYVLRCTKHGYRVRLVRGAGVREARWTDVEDAVTTVRRGHPCVELRLRDGRTTTIPAGLLAIDKEQFVRELQQHLQRGHGLRPLKRKRRPEAG